MTVSETFGVESGGAFAARRNLRSAFGAGALDAHDTGLPSISTRGLAQASHRHEAAVWFERDSTPRFVLDSEGRILRANAKGRALVSSGVFGVGGLLLCSAHRDRARLDAVLKRISDHQETEGRVLVRGQDDAWCLLELFGAEEFNGRIFASMRRASEIAPEKVEPLRAVFGLTRAESIVLAHLTVGDAPKDIGRKLSMSTHTVRAHLRAIFMKMGVKGINGTLRLTFQLAL